MAEGDLVTLSIADVKVFIILLLASIRLFNKKCMQMNDWNSCQTPPIIKQFSIPSIPIILLKMSF